ncbi:hypothetical protein PY650_29800 [Rhizobium calliandrae]|uniref:Uncharacterized protein n=1 Tax=Rhizobium calliandrae TaxID=1312182 RepID=A0ABT7KNM0_9HYPH|nr:hypothetical protein [Rhizobium calliandrae]MDL2409742.1 hypothetical protein [Rhizobium calliandrae]
MGRFYRRLASPSRRGARIIAINPLRERALERFEAPQAPIEMATLSSTPIASRYFQVKVGGDAAALKGICKALVSMDKAAKAADLAPVLVHSFIAATPQVSMRLSTTSKAEWGAIERASGLRREDLEQIATAYAASSATIVSSAWALPSTSPARPTFSR